jgi:hypothetical protein
MSQPVWILIVTIKLNASIPLNVLIYLVIMKPIVAMQAIRQLNAQIPRHAKTMDVMIKSATMNIVITQQKMVLLLLSALMCLQVVWTVVVKIQIAMII